MDDKYVISLDVGSLLLGVKAAAVALKGLDRILSSLRDTMQEAFSVRGFSDYKDTVKRYGKEMADSLLVMQLSFGKLKHAIADAAAPIVGYFVPMINQAIQAAIRFANTVGQVMGLLFGARDGSDALADSQDALASATSSAGRAARRSVMGFDELNRLNAGSGGGGGSSITAGSGYNTPISEKAMEIARKIREFLQPLKEIDLTPLRMALEQLWVAVQPILQALGQALRWLWFEVLTPFIAWVLEELAPAFTVTLASALELAGSLLGPLQAGWEALWEAISPIIGFIGSVVISALEALQQTFSGMTQGIGTDGTHLTAALQNVAAVIRSIWTVAEPVLQFLSQGFATAFGAIGRVVGDAAGFIMEALAGITQFLAQIFAGNWSGAWQSVVDLLRSAVNKVISLLNTMIRGVVSAINGVVGAANRLRFTIPSWVPVYGGRTFGMNLSSVSAPQIPMLAKGAVLPANKPFLAMLGDQRHGTNIEAPLATIEQALDNVLARQDQGQVVDTLQRILQAVLGIQIGDTVIGQAAQRYQSRMGIIQGF